MAGSGNVERKSRVWFWLGHWSHIGVSATLACVVIVTVMIYTQANQTAMMSEIPWLDAADSNNINYLERKLIQTGRQGKLLSGDCEKRLPKAIIIGVMKAGTEAFTTFLGIHPKVAMQFESPAAMFFNSDNYSLGYDWYRQMMMCSKSDQITMEKSPQYFSSPRAPERIYKMNPKMKLIVLLREPFDRAVSHFLQMKSVNPERLVADTFESCVMYPNKTLRTDSPFIYQSTYIMIIKRWLHYFPPSQILFIDGDAFKENPFRQLHKTENFLGIPKYFSEDHLYYDGEKGFFCIKINSTRPEDLELSCLEKGKGREHPNINPRLKQKLQKYFKPYNEELFRLLKRRLPW